jgi:hypothetical protein
MRRLRDDGMSMQEVSAWLGHSGVEVTQKVYAFLGVDQLHQAVKLSHKRRHDLDSIAQANAQRGKNPHADGHNPQIVDQRTYS